MAFLFNNARDAGEKKNTVLMDRDPLAIYMLPVGVDDHYWIIHI